MVMSAEHMSKFAALLRQWWRLHMSEKFSSGTKKPQTNEKENSLFLKNYNAILSNAEMKLSMYKVNTRSQACLHRSRPALCALDVLILESVLD